jgi:hypothetical protein
VYCAAGFASAGCVEVQNVERQERGHRTTAHHSTPQQRTRRPHKSTPSVGRGDQLRVEANPHCLSLAAGQIGLGRQTEIIISRKTRHAHTRRESGLVALRAATQSCLQFEITTAAGSSRQQAAWWKRLRSEQPTARHNQHAAASCDTPHNSPVAGVGRPGLGVGRGAAVLEARCSRCGDGWRRLGPEGSG